MFIRHRSTLLTIAKTLNKTKVQWAIGASLMLQCYEIVDQAHDIDIVIAESDIECALDAIKSIATPLPTTQKDEYLSRYFRPFSINGVDLDIMSGFKIKHSAGVYHFPFNTTNITKTIALDGIEIPFSSLEDWYIAYLLMPGRAAKVKLIEAYFKREGIQYPQLLENALKQVLPADVRAKIIKLLGPDFSIQEVPQ